MSEKTRLLSYVRTALTNVPPAVRFRLTHSKAEGDPESLFLAKVTGDNLEATAELIATRSLEAAAQVTASYGGMPQRFVLSAISASKERISIHPWLDKSAKSMPIALPGLSGETEPPTTAGLTGQAMRHAEVATRTLVESVSGILEHQNRVIQEQREMLDAQGKDRMKLTLLLEELRSKKDEREMIRETFERGESRKDAVIKKLVDEILPDAAGYIKAYAAPKLMAMLAGGEEAKPAPTPAPPATPKEATPTEPAPKIKLRQLVASLDDDQQEKLIALFRPEQARLLTEALGGRPDESETEETH